MPEQELRFGDVVVYNGGEGKSHRLAFVTDTKVVNEEDEGLLANLLVFDGEGQGKIEPDVPRRSPDDYADADPPGGGNTWFYRD